MTSAATASAVEEIDTAVLIPRKQSEETYYVSDVSRNREEAERRFRHSEKTERKRAACCRFFCFFGVFFGLVFLLMAPISWWQTLVCSPTPSVWENSLIGITVTGRAQSFFATVPHLEKTWYGDTSMPLSKEHIFNGVGVFETTRGLLFWALPGEIHVYSRDGIKKSSSIQVPPAVLSPNVTFQAITIEQVSANVGDFILYALHPDGKIFTYSPLNGWKKLALIFTESPTTSFTWNFAYYNSQTRCLYSIMNTPSSSMLVRLDLNSLRKTFHAVSSSFLTSRHSYDPQTDTFYWMKANGDEGIEGLEDRSRIEVRSASLSLTSSKMKETQVTVLYHEDLAKCIRYEHKFTFDPKEKRFFVLDPYSLKFFVFSFEEQQASLEIESEIQVDTYRTRITYPVYLQFSSGYRF